MNTPRTVWGGVRRIAEALWPLALTIDSEREKDRQTDGDSVSKERSE